VAADGQGVRAAAVTEAQLLALAAQHARKASVTLDDWISRVRDPKYPWRKTEWGKALLALEQVKRLPASNPAPAFVPSPFAGKGVFTTSNASSASFLDCDWVALQKDPEGDLTPIILNSPGRICWWQARPTQAVIDQAREHGIPYIGQAENEAELGHLLSLDTSGLFAKAIVGNAGSWGASGRVLADTHGWNLIQEWYANAHPWETAPDAHNYPRLASVCFGIYSEGTPGGLGYVPQVPLSRYLAVWHGSFSVWKAEAMTPADKTAFDAA
jgi:hypothetical protein